MKIKVSSGFSGVLPTGSFSNARPSFMAEVEYEGEESSISSMQDRLHKICYDKFQSIAEEARVDFVKAQKANFRFHEFVNDKGITELYPSISTVASYDKDFSQIAPHELNQYCSHGNLEDLRCKHFILTGEWLPLDKVPNSYTDLAVLKNGNLRLQAGTFNFPAFLQKYPLTNMKVGELVFNHNNKTAGTPDFTAEFEGKKILADFKRTPDKSYYIQLGGYASAIGEKFDELWLIGVNTDTQQGFSKAVITTEVEQCQQMFDRKREEFKKIFMV